jgi:hypothetical protein
MPTIPALRKQDDHKFRGQPGLHREFQASLDYIVRHYLQKDDTSKK